MGRHRVSGVAKISKIALIAAPVALLVVIVFGVWLNMTATAKLAPAVPQPPGLTANEVSAPPASSTKAKPTTAAAAAPVEEGVPQVAVVQFGLGSNGKCQIQSGQVKPGVKVVACFVDGKQMYVIFTTDEEQAAPSSSALN